MKMVERMARAMCARVYGDNHYNHYWEQYKAEYIDNALAALRAMREPNDAMHVAGLSSGNPDGAWRLMIDSAIREAEAE